MTIVGSPDVWARQFPVDMIQPILRLILQVWRRFPKPTPTELETRTTKRFRAALRRSKRQRALPLLIDREVVEDDLVGHEKGRIDIRFIAGFREEVYFAFECKRMNVVSKSGKIASRAIAYVDKGVARFVSGQYAQNLRHGGMLAYVHDGNTTSAVRSVQLALRRRQDELFVLGGGSMIPSPFVSSKVVFQTAHQPSARALALQHVFLSCV